MQIEDFLDNGEEILWVGAPPRGVVLRAWDIFLVPFSILWGGFALFWTLIVIVSAISQSEGGGIDVRFTPFLIIGLVFSLFGLFLIFGRFIVDMTRRASTEYAVTTKRAIILSGFFGRSFDSMPLTASLRISVSGERRGSIKFGAGYGFFDFMNFSTAFGFWIGPSHPFVFEQIENVREVYGIVRGVQERRR